MKVKAAILKVLMDNTHIEGRYIGGGDEPAIIVFNDCDDQDKERYLSYLVDQLVKVVDKVELGEDAPDEGYYVPKLEEFRFGFEYEVYVAGSNDRYEKKVFDHKEALFIENVYNSNIEYGWIRKQKAK